jgi:tol-pal system protein YbgF
MRLHRNYMTRLLSLSALLFAVTLPAAAQRASLADRVAALEQQASNNQGNVELLNQVTQLRSELQAQRSQIEELQHQLEAMQQSSKNQYIDLDSRLGRLEGGAPAAPAAAPALPAPPPAATKPGAKPPAKARPTAATSATLPAAPADTAPSVHGDAGSLAQAGDERAAYDNAFSALKAGQYAESARRFQGFLTQFPNGTYAPNALYWLGESYYVTQNFALAQQQFQALLDRYPTHDKAPGALLKVGLSQYGQQQADAAAATLQQVVQRYPGTDAAARAQDQLKVLQLAKEH